MLRTPSILGPLSSGFVPLSPAAPLEPLAHDGDVVERDASVAEDEATEVVARIAAAPAVRVSPAATVTPWSPRSSVHARVVEGAVIAAMCCYFGWGLLRTLAGL